MLLLRLVRWTFFGFIVHIVAYALVILIWTQDANLINKIVDFNGRLTKAIAGAIDGSGRLESTLRLFFNLDKALLFTEVAILLIGVLLTIRSFAKMWRHGHDHG